MASITEHLRGIASRVFDALDAHDDGRSLSSTVRRLDDESLAALMKDAAAARSEFDALIAAAAGVVAQRSERARGYGGLAQATGHRSPVAMVQTLTGSTRAEASRHVRLGEAMSAAEACDTGEDADPDSLFIVSGGEGMGGLVGAEAAEGAPQNATVPAVRLPWHEPLTRAVNEHRLSSEAMATIMRGLGEPNERCDQEVLRRAADRLVATAGDAHADELGRRARDLRDELDPAGVRLREEERYEARSWRFGRNARGMRTAYVEFDDESAAWVDATVGAALRPRRGGPRFVDKDEAARAKELVEDPRTNDQLVFDLMMEAIKAGVEADPRVAFGSRQPGIRVVITEQQLNARDDDGRRTGNGYYEETGEAISGATVERLICNVGTREVRLDHQGSPLDVGREQRLFTSKQRVALSIRDGGCRVPGCDRPPSYCEAHHIDTWTAEKGRTDVDRGVLLCRYHHMWVHNNGWKVAHDDVGFWLIPPPTVDATRTPIPMPSRSPLQRDWLPTMPNAEPTAMGAHAAGAGAQAESARAHAEGASAHAEDASAHAEGGRTRAEGLRAQEERLEGTRAQAGTEHTTPGRRPNAEHVSGAPEPRLPTTPTMADVRAAAEHANVLARI